jgi:hypothetical protein
MTKDLMMYQLTVSNILNIMSACENVKDKRKAIEKFIIDNNLDSSDDTFTVCNDGIGNNEEDKTVFVDIRFVEPCLLKPEKNMAFLIYVSGEWKEMMILGIEDMIRGIKRLKCVPLDGAILNDKFLVGNHCITIYKTCVY